MLAACGDGDDSGSSADQAATPTPTVAVSVFATPKAGKPKPTAKTSAAATPGATTGATTAATPKPTKAAPTGPGYRIAMPDGRTAPENADFAFKNLVIKGNQQGNVAGTVDVTYNGPGLASMAFRAVISINRGPSPFNGEPVIDKVNFQGTVTALRAGATETVPLLGGSPAYYQEGQEYTGEYFVDSVQDDDPKARAE